jgi:hypothetical protein
LAGARVLWGREGARGKGREEIASLSSSSCVLACLIPEGNDLIKLVELKKKKLVKSIQSL